jgi:hypothetical protein
MKIHLSPVKETELTTLMPLRARHAPEHTLTDDPRDADLILLIGSFGREHHFLLDHPLYREFPDKCAVYTEDDNYLPLAPGVYSSAHIDEHSRMGRIFSYSYVSRGGQYANPFVPEPGELAPEKSLLFSFQGGSTSILRKKLFNLKFNRADCLIENTSTYYHWDLSQPGREDRQRHYANTLATSHFVLCPRGAGAGSIRLFEVMSAGICPVLISDEYQLPPNVDWDSFLIRIRESEIGKLPELIEPFRASSAERGRLARAAWLEHFAPEKEFNNIVTLAAASLKHGPPSEADHRKRQKKIIAAAERRRKLRDLAKAAVLKTLKILHLKSPYQMNR